MNNKYETLYIKSRGSNVVGSSIGAMIQRSQSSTSKTLKHFMFQTFHGSLQTEQTTQFHSKL